MREVAVKWAGGPFAQDVEVAGHHLRADEEAEKGGEDTGAAPHELLLAALGMHRDDPEGLCSAEGLAGP